MILIAHRGNVVGPNPDKENHPDYILEAIKSGFHVEIDLWLANNQLHLGHDEPQYPIKPEFLYNESFWIHAKNIDTAYYLTKHKDLHWFFHDQDDCVLTSRGYLWTYPGKQLTPESIAVMPERITTPYDLSLSCGICTDYPIKYFFK